MGPPTPVRSRTVVTGWSCRRAHCRKHAVWPHEVLGQVETNCGPTCCGTRPIGTQLLTRSADLQKNVSATNVLKKERKWHLVISVGININTGLAVCSGWTTNRFYFQCWQKAVRVMAPCIVTSMAATTQQTIHLAFGRQKNGGCNYWEWRYSVHSLATIAGSRIQWSKPHKVVGQENWTSLVTVGKIMHRTRSCILPWLVKKLSLLVC